MDAARVQLLDSVNIEHFTNDGWGLATWSDQSQTEFGHVGAFPLTNNSNDAVILGRVDPGQYNVILSSPSGTTGVGLVEVYEN